jgi:murein tripeptide amidase MpaA
MKVLGPWSVAIVAALGCSLANAQLRPTDQVSLEKDQRIRFDGDDLVEANIETDAELTALEALAVTIWSERPGIGSVVVQINDGAGAQLDALGIEYRVLHPNVQDLIDAEWDSIQQAAQQRGGAWYESYHQYNDIVTRFNDLAAAYPAIATRESAGSSLQGRDIPVVRITGPGDASNRPMVFINGCQHAREWVSPATVMYIAERLMEDYGSDQRVTDLLNSVEVVIAPMVNPDGYVYSWTSNRMWRKNRRGSYGVDLNRNWGWEWGGLGSSGQTSSEVYRGTAPFSEPESAAIRDYVLPDADRMVAAIDYHSYSQLILWPWGYDAVDPPAEDLVRFQTIGFGIRDEILNSGGVPYTPEPAYELYPAAGTAQDWFYGAGTALAYTIELRDTGNFGFILPASQILPTASENWAGFLYFAEQTTRAISISIIGSPPDSVGASIASTLDLTISNGSSSYVLGSGLLYTSTDGTNFTSSALASLGGSTYRATFPTFVCGSTISYYITAQAADGSLLSLPASGPAGAFTATAVESNAVFSDAMETGTNGWAGGVAGDTATTGQWELGNPQGTAAQPEDDNTAAGSNCWITGRSSGGSLGANDIDSGYTTLISPRLDASEAAADGVDAYLVFYRWYSNDRGASPNADSMPIEISNNDGATWTQIELVNENLNRWERKEFNIGSFITPTNQVRVRFIARDLGSGSIVEAGVDDLSLEIRGCPCAPADLNCDGTLDFFDIQEFLERFAAQDPRADMNGDGEFNFFDVQAYLDLFSNG